MEIYNHTTHEHDLLNSLKWTSVVREDDWQQQKTKPFMIEQSLHVIERRNKFTILFQHRYIFNRSYMRTPLWHFLVTEVSAYRTEVRL